MDPRAIGGSDPGSDAERFARMSPAERLDLFLQLCDLMDSVQAGRPDRERLRAPHPRSAEALALWARLMAERSCDR
ncbi:MAG: hypothetical protein OXU20_24890 [Myxococcales bacterium]|nr:hypothetical protein [Myxococcales bacterium]